MTRAGCWGKGCSRQGRQGELKRPKWLKGGLIFPPAPAPAQAVANVNEIIGPKLVGMDVREQKLIDEAESRSFEASRLRGAGRQVGRQAGRQWQAHATLTRLWRSWFSSWTAPRTSGAQLRELASMGRFCRVLIAPPCRGWSKSKLGPGLWFSWLSDEGTVSFCREVPMQSWPCPWRSAVLAQLRARDPARAHGGRETSRTCTRGAVNTQSSESPAGGQMPLYQYIAKISGKPTDKPGA